MIDIEERILAIFDVTNENLQEAGKSMPVSRDVYALYTYNPSNEADYYDLIKLNKKDFPYAVYLLLLGRPLDSEAEENFKSIGENLSEQAYKNAVLRSVLTSEEFTIKKSVIRNCFLLSSKEKCLVKDLINRLLFHILRIIPVFRIWKRTPKRFRKKIKSLFKENNI